MDQELLKTSKKQRIIIGAIAFLMLGAMIASYSAIILANKDADAGSDLDPELQAKLAKYQQEYNAKTDELVIASRDFYHEFINYRSEIKAFNEAAANTVGVDVRDIKEGNGRVLEEGDLDYFAYYVGWCADETVFDSTFDSAAYPSRFSKILDPEVGLIEGWNAGVVGMKINGIREITIPGELAYGDTREICGGYNKPLKFMIMAVDKTEDLKRISGELDLIQMKMQYAYYGLDYEALMGEGEDEPAEETQPDGENE